MTAGVYALIDPVSELVMYVGQSSCVEDRVRKHIWTPSHPVAKWMLQVKGNGERPIVQMWAVGSQPERDALERQLIAENRRSVLNINSGGLSGFTRMLPSGQKPQNNKATLFRPGETQESIASHDPVEVMRWIIERLNLGEIDASFADGRKLRHSPEVRRSDFRRRLAKLLIHGDHGFNR